MTAGSGRQQNRYNELKNYVNSGKHTGHNDALTEAIYNWMFNNAGYKTSGTDWEKYGSPDLNKIAASKGKKFDRIAAVDDAVKDYKKYYTDNLVKDLNKRNNYELTSDNFVYDLTNNSNNFVDDYLKDYYNDAFSQLDGALKRGLLTDMSYDKALGQLNSKNASWDNSLTNSLNSMINDYGTAYDTARNNYNTSKDSVVADFDTNFFNNYTGNGDEFNSLFNNKVNFDNNYNIDTLYSGFLDNANASTGGLPFDISQLIANAKVASGINNTQSNELIGAIEDQQKQEEKKIGLGNQGVF